MTTNIILGKNTQLETKVLEDTIFEGIYILRKNENLALEHVFSFTRESVTSKILIKAIIYEGASFKYNGLVKIEKGAINTDVYLKIKCLLIGKNSKAITIPNLEISEENVQAGHGATIGHIDNNMLYYLESRGLSKLSSQKFLIDAFINS